MPVTRLVARAKAPPPGHNDPPRSPRVPAPALDGIAPPVREISHRPIRTQGLIWLWAGEMPSRMLLWLGLLSAFRRPLRPGAKSACGTASVTACLTCGQLSVSICWCPSPARVGVTHFVTRSADQAAANRCLRRSFRSLWQVRLSRCRPGSSSSGCRSMSVVSAPFWHARLARARTLLRLCVLAHVAARYRYNLVHEMEVS